MLPALPSPQPSSHPQLRRIQALLLGGVLLLLLGLSACSRVSSPAHEVVVSALKLQIELTQDAIAQALDRPAQGQPEVSHVRIDEQRSLTIGNGRGLRLSGRFDWRLADDPTAMQSPFELYLQRGERDQSWRLARPVGSDVGGERQQWLIDPLPIKG